MTNAKSFNFEFYDGYFGVHGDLSEVAIELVKFIGPDLTATREGAVVTVTVEPERVWVLERDIDSEIVGVYRTLQAAIAAAYPKRGDFVSPVLEKMDGDDVAYIRAGDYAFIAWREPLR